MNISQFRRYLSKQRNKIILTMFLSAIVFILFIVFFVGPSTTKRATIICDPGYYQYYTGEGNRFDHYEINIKILQTVSCMENYTNPPITGYFTKPTIIIYDENNTVISENDPNHEYSVFCYTRELSIGITYSEPYIAYYEITVIAKHYKIARPISYCFLSCLGFSVIISAIFYLNQVRIDKITFQSIPDSLPENNFKTKTLREIPRVESRLLFVDYKTLPENSFCMISKTTFEKDDEIAQCPKCFSYYQTDYIFDWLTSNETCPVCKTILKKK